MLPFSSFLTGYAGNLAAEGRRFWWGMSALGVISSPIVAQEAVPEFPAPDVYSSISQSEDVLPSVPVDRSESAAAPFPDAPYSVDPVEIVPGEIVPTDYSLNGPLPANGESFNFGQAGELDSDDSLSPFAASDSEAFGEEYTLEPPPVGPSSGLDFSPDVFFAPDAFGLTSGILDGFSMRGVTATLVYDSNASGNAGRALGNSKEDITATLGTGFTYHGGNSSWKYGANLGLGYSQYFNNTDRSGLNYNLRLNGGYTGGKIRFTVSLGSSLLGGNNSNYDNANVDTLDFNTNLGLTYQHSVKTSIVSGLGYRWSEADQSVFSSTYSLNWNISAMWRLSPLTQIGPGFAYSISGGNAQGDRQTYGPTVRIIYKLSEKVAMDGTFGLDFVDANSGGGGGTSFTTNLGINYRASSLWGASLSVFKGTVPYGGIGGGYRDTFNVNLGYNRLIRRVSTSVGIAYNMNSASGAGSGPGTDGDYLSFNARASTPIFKDRVNAALFYTLRGQSGGVNQRGGYSVGLSLNASL